MKRFLFLALAALTSGLAQANFVGLESEVYTESDFGTVYRVYAKFDSPTDELVAVYALETSPMVLDVTTSFYQDAVGGTLGNTINPAFFGAFPSLEFDSWFTIGSADSNGTSLIQQIGMDDAFALFETGAGFTLDAFVGGSYFLIPDVSADAEAGVDGRVLIGQFTTDGVVNLTVNLQWDDVDANTTNSLGISISFPFVEVSGCTNATAENYNPLATEEDGSCTFASGCTNASADNYDAAAIEDDGSCTFGGGLLTGLSYEVVAVNPIGTGQNTYRLYADFSSPNIEVTAIYGTDSTPWQMVSDATDGFYNEAVGSDFGGEINPIFFGLLPGLEFDSWFTIGAQPGDANGLNSAFDSALNSLANFNNGGAFVVNTFIGGSIFIIPGVTDQGVPVAGKVLLGQFTTSGAVDALVNIQFRNLANPAQESIYAEGLTLSIPQSGVGCMEPTACNYDPSAELDDGSCAVNDECGTCGGTGIPSGDCDCNGNVLDECGVCGGTGIPSGACDCEGNVLDECGVCGGGGIADGDCDCAGNQLDVCGICGGEGTTCGGCMDASACNYDAAATDDGPCTYAEAGYDCDGLCLSDTDTDGVCDEFEVIGCQDATACDYNVSATDSGLCDFSCIGCAYEGACNFDAAVTTDDGSCTYAEAGYDCDGLCLSDTDTDGICDEFEVSGCTYPGADNYDAGNEFEDGSCIFSGCTDPAAENYVAYANTDDGTCGPCGVANDCPFDANGDGEIGSADLLNFLIVYGQSCDNL